MSKTVYIKCPRCELNFIQKREKLCPVCKQEMQSVSTNYAEDSASLGLCPICKVNYITEDENVCGTCVGESDLSEEEIDALYGNIAIERDGVDEEDEIVDDEEELEILSLEMEDEMDEDMEEDSSDPLDDFEDPGEGDEDDEDDEK